MTSKIDDIEDLWKESEPSKRLPRENEVTARAKASRINKRPEEAVENAHVDSFVPGTQKVYVKTWGCSHNNSDSEYMAGQLAAAGYPVTGKKDDADLWLLNSCTVKSPSEDHFRNEVEKGMKEGKKVVVAGCVPQGQPKASYLQGLSVVGVQQIDRVVEVVEQTLQGNRVRLLGTKKQSGKKIGGASLDLPKIRKNPLIEIIAINTGCLNQCTYCKTKHARGELGSYPPEEIVQRAKASFQEGVVEIWLTSEDLGAYGHDIGVTLPELLWQLVEVIPEGARLRLGMTNPPYILEHLQEVSKILAHPRVYSFLHVPVQAGSDSVLMDMKREYCQQDFRHVVEFLKKSVPKMNIATDVICGFPTETDEDFEETLQLVRDYKFPSLFINQFFPRPGTPAARMPRLPPREAKKRTKAITELFHTYTPYDSQVGERQEILVTEVSHDGNYYVGHNKSYNQVLIEKDAELLGKMVEVEIVSSSKHSMKGERIDGGGVWRPVSVPPPLTQGQLSGIKVNQVSDDEDLAHTGLHRWGVVILGVAVTAYVAFRVSRISSHLGIGLPFKK